MLEINDNIYCCGLREISQLGSHRTAVQALKEFCRQAYNYWDDSNFRYVVFTEASDGAYGKNFTAYILKNGLGEVIQTSKNVNPNSGHQLVAYLWTVNHDTLKVWAKKHKIRVEDENPDMEDEWSW